MLSSGACNVVLRFNHASIACHVDIALPKEYPAGPVIAAAGRATAAAGHDHGPAPTSTSTTTRSNSLEIWLRSASGLTRAQLTSINNRLAEATDEYVRDYPDTECVLWCINRLQELLQDGHMHDHADTSGRLADAATAVYQAARPADAAGGIAALTIAPQQAVGHHVYRPRIKHVWVWFHHVKSGAKKGAIVEWAGELGITGACKPGFPGALYCRGLESDVDEYIRRLKALQWQAMVVRDEMITEEDGDDDDGDEEAQGLQGTGGAAAGAASHSSRPQLSPASVERHQHRPRQPQQPHHQPQHQLHECVMQLLGEGEMDVLASIMRSLGDGMYARFRGAILRL